MTEPTLLHYHLVEKLGEGGMGVVYKARDSRLDRHVAIKLLQHWGQAGAPERARFRIEAQAAAALNHPNIATVHAIEESDGQLFIVMEWVEGRELGGLIGGDGLDAETALGIAMQVAEGLRVAHAKHIVHRDIKAANIMVTPSGLTKIMDFGLAKVGAGTELTRSGTVLGTVSYMSPEQLRGMPLDERSDIWSFGVVLYEMLSGQRPFRGEYDHAVADAILKDVPPPPRMPAKLPRRMADVVMKALAKDRDDRYQRMTEVIAAFESIHHEMSSLPRREGSDPAGPLRRIKLAVLPFASLKKDPDTDFLGFALADQVIGSLSYVKNVLVRPSIAVRKYQDQGVDAATAGRELQVDYILMGYYLRAGQRVRLNVELVEVESNEMRWREPLEVDYTDVFQLQDLVSAKVLDGLKVRFSNDERDRMQADVPGNPLAYEFYLRAVACPQTLANNRLAIELLEKSVALDSSYAPAHAELGFRLDQVAAEAMLGVEEQRRAERVLGQALALNPDLLSALGQLSSHYTNIGRSAEAAALVDHMFRVAPDNAVSHFALGRLYRYTGLLDESAQAFDRALARERNNPRFRSAGFTFVYRGEYQKAYEIFDLDPAGTVSIAWKGMMLLALGDRERAVQLLDQAAAMEPDSYAGLRHAAISAFLKGNTPDGLGLLRRLEQRVLSDLDSEHWYLLATAYGLLGDGPGCINAMKRAVDGGFFCYPRFLSDSSMDVVRETAAFQDVMAQAKARHDAFRQTRDRPSDRTVTRLDDAR